MTSTPEPRGTGRPPGSPPVACEHGPVGTDVSQFARPRRGHFDLGTGYHGDLWLDLDGLFFRPALVRPQARLLADWLRPYRAAAVCGPLAGGAFLAQMVAEDLGAAFVPAYPGPRQPGRFRLPAPAAGDIGGWRVAVVDDAVNAGTAVRASIQAARNAGAVPVAAAALLAVGPAAAAAPRDFGLPFHALAALRSQAWPAGGCPLCRDGIPAERPPA